MRFARGTAAGAFVLAAAAAVYSGIFGPGPNSTTIPSTGQTLSIQITAPPDGSMHTEGPVQVEGGCAIDELPAQTINVLYVLDVSGSTDLTFMLQQNPPIPLVDADGNGTAGDAGDDFNGDGEAGEILDGEISGVLSLHASIGNPSSVNVGLEAFASNASAADVGPAAGFQFFTTPPQNDAGGASGPDINEVVRSFRSEHSGGGSIGQFTAVPQSSLGNATDFEAAMAVIGTTLASFPQPATNIVFFLSDGVSNEGRCVEGDCAEELAALPADTTINTVGVGAAADDEDLQFIATATGGTYLQVLDPSDLATQLPLITPAGIDRVEVNGQQVPIPTGTFATNVNCTVPGITVTATCFASDPAGTNVSADIMLGCSSTTTTTMPPVCGNGMVEFGEDCDGGDCCTPSCEFEPIGTTCSSGPNPTQCSTKQCDGEGACAAFPLSNSACNGGPCPCDDGDICTENEVCIGGQCVGSPGQDTDGDGECDAREIECGCNFNDAQEGCLLPNRLVGRAGNGAGEVLMTWHTPTVRRIKIESDESCTTTAGQCGDDGRCTTGKVRDVCAANADCNQQDATCRLIVNWANATDLTLTRAQVQRTDIGGFQPATPGCSRRVDVFFDGVKRALRLKAKGTVDGRPRRDRDTFRYRNSGG
jgi:hypothetical protein